MPCMKSTEENSSRIESNTPQTIANLFNKYFASVFTVSCLQYCDSSDADCDPLLSDGMLSKGEVQTVLQSLDVTKAAGVDNIPFQPDYYAKLPLLPHHRSVNYLIS